MTGSDPLRFIHSGFFAREYTRLAVAKLQCPIGGPEASPRSARRPRSESKQAFRGPEYVGDRLYMQITDYGRNQTLQMRNGVK
jgi:hypothetical protein